MTLEEHLARIRAKVAAAAEEVGRNPEEITLEAATKTQSALTIRAAIAAGITVCGENRVQELTAHLAAHAPSVPLSSGTAWVKFSLDESGALLSVRLGRSSGRPVFDRACLASIRAAQPFPQPPPGISRAGLIFEVPITAPVRTGGALKIGPR